MKKIYLVKSKSLNWYYLESEDGIVMTPAERWANKDDAMAWGEGWCSSWNLMRFMGEKEENVKDK